MSDCTSFQELLEFSRNKLCCVVRHNCVRQAMRCEQLTNVFPWKGPAKSICKRPKRTSATEPPSVAAPSRTHQNLEEARSLLSVSQE
ncbi:hypothetical protein T10_6415 [Trichinella papuae]|uniref:Uncharacterized protein n=1 Tax=Trichinella papuae TaxID=268474 RepID=A0A0V1N252_9BILA|nr:hypothetical protein T10_6415 [Trichinella papuae]